MQNCWGIDSDHTDWFMTIGDAPKLYSNCFQVASTGAYAYSTNNKFQMCGDVNVANGGFHGAGQGGPETLDIDDFISVNPRSLAGAIRRTFYSNSRSIMTITGHTIKNGDYSQFDYLSFFNTSGQFIISNALYDLPNINAAVTDLINSWGYGSTEIDNFSAQGVTIDISDTDTNRNDQDSTPANGLKYPIRQEEGSYLRANNLGADNLDFCIGKQGCYTDDTDAETVTTIPVLPKKMERVAMEAWGETDWTGPNLLTGVGGSDTLEGDFGVADGTDSPSDYILASLGEPVFPLCVNSVSTAATTARISWKHPYPKHYDNIVTYEVFYKNVTDSGAWTLFGSVTREKNVLIVTGLTATKLYNFYVRSTYADGRSSGKSYETSIQL